MKINLFLAILKKRLDKIEIMLYNRGMDLIGKYRCLKCKHKWSESPLPNMGTTCPKCKHVYIKWLNFKQIERITKDD